jgi:hypothetical protein
LESLSYIQKVGLSLLAIAVLIAVVGYTNHYGNLYLGEWVGGFLQDYYANISAELVSIAVTVLIVDVLYEQRNTAREKRDLVSQMGSPDNRFALEAVRKLGMHSWLTDGTLRGAQLSGADLREAQLLGADLTKAFLSQATLAGANLSESNLGDVVLSEANLAGADLVGASLNRADLSGADVSEANLGGGTLDCAELIGANLAGADLWGTHLSNALLSEANLTGANLIRATLDGTDLWGANLSRARVTHVQLAQASTLEGTTMPDGTKFAEEHWHTEFADWRKKQQAEQEMLEIND